MFKPWKHQAICENPGRQWQTRRLSGLKEINQAPGNWVVGGTCFEGWVFGGKDGKGITVKPRYHIGEIVYIKEAWCENYDASKIHYKLDGGESPGPKGFWRSPLSLKASNARTFIQITAVRVERLNSIPPEDCIAEGIIDIGAGDSRGMFACLWDSINQKQPWGSNPWVFVYSFVKVDRP